MTSRIKRKILNIDSDLFSKKLSLIQHGLYSIHRYKHHCMSLLNSSHVLTDIMLEQKEQICSEFTVHADLECIENRYLLCGLSDGGISLYDTQIPKNVKNYTLLKQIKGGERRSHKYQVDCIQWYPADTGMFVTSCRDSTVKIWDTNLMKVAEKILLKCYVRYHSMSAVTTHHSLLAVAGDTGEVFLCDLRTGSSSHQLIGHDGSVVYLKWALCNEYWIATGGKDQTVRMWDVRAGKSCVHVFDIHQPVQSYLESKHKKRKKLKISHRGRVISLCFTKDSLWLISLSSYGELRVWNPISAVPLDVHFDSISTNFKRHIEMAVSSGTSSDMIYVPSANNILAFEVTSGKCVNILKGHLSSVVGVVHNPVSNVLHSYGNDHNFLTWMPELLFSSLNEELDLVESSDNWDSDE